MLEEYYLRIKNNDVVSNRAYGSKGLRLIRLYSLGFDVPDGIILSVEFLEHLIKSSGLERKIKKVSSLEKNNGKGLDSLVLNFMKNADFDINTLKELDEKLKNIEGYGRNIKFAVRSAALGEDDDSSSFAGQYSTILGVSPGDVWNAVFQCYASWWTDRAVSYRRKNKKRTLKPGISVIIQRQLNSQFSGVLFTKNPVDMKKDIMIAEAVKGFGEVLVSGEAKPFRWEIDRCTGKILKEDPDANRGIKGFKGSFLQELHLTGKKLEAEFGEGLDIEWSIEKGKLFLLQMRPITAIPAHKKNKKTSRSSHEDAVHLTDSIYSRAIIEDLWSDRMTNITSSIVFGEFGHLYTFKTPLEKLRLKEIAEQPAITVVNGYGYLNSRVIAMLLELLPEKIRFREIQKMFPPLIRENVLSIPFKFRSLLKLLPWVPFLVNDLSMLPFFTVPLLKRHLKKIDALLNSVDDSSYSEMNLIEIISEMERLLKIQCRLQVKNQWGYGNAAVFTWMFRHFAVGFMGRSEEWVLNSMTRIPSNITLKSQKHLKRICGLCDGEVLKKAFSKKYGDKIWEVLLSEFSDHIVTKEILKFIEIYKFRSANRDFIHPRWDESPGLVVDLISLLMKSDDKKRIQSGTASIAPGKKFFNIIFYPLLLLLARVSRSFLALREDLRFGLDKIFYRIRKLLIAAAQTPELKKLKNNKNAVFFLELNELRSFSDNKYAIEKLLPIVKKRMRDFYNDREKPPPYYIRMKKNGPQAISSIPDKSTGLIGTPASAGKAVGKARVIKNPEEFSSLEKGEILVAYNTDPGWTPLFMTAAGVVVEMGGILNHCAIVAREYSVPAVVGVQGITKKIKTGQVISIDGSSGRVEVIIK